MAIAFRSEAHATAALSGSITINKPAGTVQYDVMLAHIATYSDQDVTITPPSGWTLVRSTSATYHRSWTYYKVAGASEPTSYTFTASATAYLNGAIRSYSGANTTSPINASNAQATPSGTSHSTPSITTTVNNTMITTFFGVMSNTTWTPPSGEVERYDQVYTLVTIEGADELQASAGASGSKTATSAAAGVGSAHIIALAPASQEFTKALTDSLLLAEVFNAVRVVISWTKTLVDTIILSGVNLSRLSARRTFTDILNVAPTEQSIYNQRVAASVDDSTCVATTPHSWQNDGEQMRGGNLASYLCTSAMRFTEILIPQGATIYEAYLYLTAWDTASSSGCRTKLRAHLNPNSTPVIDDTDLHSRPLTSAFVNWDNIEPWTTGVEYQSPDITSVIQEIVNQGTWAPGNAVTIYWDDYPDGRSNYDAYRAARAFDSGQGYAPRLYIRYAGAGDIIGLVRTQARTLTDTIALTSPDASKVWTHCLALLDTILTADNALFPLWQRLVDTIGLVESFIIGFSNYKTLTDTIGLSESWVKSVTRQVEDALTLAEAFTRSVDKYFAESVVVSDSLTRTRFLALTDSVGITEVIAKSPAKLLTDTILAIDLLTKGLQRLLADSLAPSGSLGKSSSRNLNEVLSLSESAIKSTKRAITDLTLLLEMLSGPPRPKLELIPSFRSHLTLSIKFRQHLNLAATIRGGGEEQ